MAIERITIKFELGKLYKQFGTDLVRPRERSAGMHGIGETRSAENV